MLSSSELIKLRRQNLEDNNNTNGISSSEMLRIKKIGSKIDKQMVKPSKSEEYYPPVSQGFKHMVINQISGLSSSNLLNHQKQSIVDYFREQHLSSSELLELPKESIKDYTSSKKIASEFEGSLKYGTEPKEQNLVFKNIEHVVAENIHCQGELNVKEDLIVSKGDTFGEQNLNILGDIKTGGDINIDGQIYGKKSLIISDDIIVGDNLILHNDDCSISLGVNSDFKITHDSISGTTITGDSINITISGDSKFKTTSGDLIIDSEMNSLILEGYSGVTLQNSSNDITLNSTRDINLAATRGITIDGKITGKKSLIIEDNITVGNNLNLLNDNSILSFGTDNDITLTHIENTGLKLKNNSSSGYSGIGCVLTLQTGDTDISSDDTLGSINFQASDESSVLDTNQVAASISAISEGDFSNSNNTTKLSFKTSLSGQSVENMILRGNGDLSCHGDFFCAGVIETSDIRLKKDISLLKNSLEIINKLRPVSFNWKNRLNNNKKIGFIAQEVEQLLPEVVVKSPNGYKSIAYSSMVSLLVDGLKRQQQMISELNKKILKLEYKLLEQDV